MTQAWWHTLDDAVLDDLIRRAWARNPSLRGAQAAVQAAQAARDATVASQMPQIGLGASASRTQTETGGANRFGVNLNGAWQPDLRGHLAAARAAAEADVQAARADLAQTQNDLAADMATAYLQWRGALISRAISQNNLSLLQDTLEMTRWREQAGLVSAQDSEQAQLSAQQNRASVAALDSQIAQIESRLATLAGQAPEAFTLPRPADLTVLPATDAAWRSLRLGVPADVLRRRADLRSAEAAVQAAWLRRDQARRESWPGLTLNGSISAQALTLAALGQAGAAAATLAAAVDWALFDGGQRTAQVNQKDAAWQRSRAAYDAAVLSALKDVQDNLTALGANRQRVAALGRAAEAAQANWQFMRYRHQAGLVDLATLLDAQRGALSAQLGWRSAQLDEWQSVIAVAHALGGGWDAPAAAAPSGASANRPAATP